MYRIDAVRSKNSGFLVTLLLIGVVALSLVSARAPAVVPNPTVIGPIVDGPIGDASHNYPMASADPAALAAVGYLQQEFFVSGLANCYDTPRLATGGVIASGQPYMTRMMVRRPISAADFNGVVVVEWLNASSGYDIDSTWAAANSEAYIRAGSAWVGVTLQNITVQFLRTWGPARYGSLNVEPDPASACPPSADLPVSPANAYINNTAFDILSQVAQSIRNPSGVDPLAGLSRQLIIATGASQSSARLVPYINSVHPLSPVYDGFFLAIPVFDHVIRQDLPPNTARKVFKVMSEFDVFASTVESSTEPDSDTLRTWQVAGAPHTTFQNVQYRLLGIARDGITPIVFNCTLPPGGTVISRIPSKYVMAAASEHLVQWITKGTPPPTALRITTQPGTNTVLRDSFGNALGGIRLPHHEVPTATNTALGCSTYGSTVPFTQTTLDQLYRNHENYVNAVRKVANEDVLKGHILKVDAEAIVEEAKNSSFGK